MAHIEGTVFCDGCGTEITWAPIVFHNKEFCCEDCAHQLPCDCGNRMELGEDSPARHPISLPFSPP